MAKWAMVPHDSVDQGGHEGPIRGSCIRKGRWANARRFRLSLKQAGRRGVAVVSPYLGWLYYRGLAQLTRTPASTPKALRDSEP